MLKQFFLICIGFSSGSIIAGGVVGLLIGLSVLTRYAGMTHTTGYVLLYEDSLLLGTLFGSWLSIFSPTLPLGHFFLLIYGIFSGIFLGGWILALAEMADFIPVVFRRLRLNCGIPAVIVSIAAGKTLGALLYFWQGW